MLLTDKDLSKIRNLGPASLSEVKEKLAKYSPPMVDIVMKTGVLTKQTAPIIEALKSIRQMIVLLKNT